MRDNRVTRGAGYLQRMNKANGNYGEKDKHIQEQRARKQLRSRRRSCEGWVWVRGCGLFLCAAGVKAGGEAKCINGTLSMSQKWRGFRIVPLTRPPASLPFQIPNRSFPEGFWKRCLGEEGEMSPPLNANNRPVCL